MNRDGNHGVWFGSWVPDLGSSLSSTVLEQVNGIYLCTEPLPSGVALNESQMDCARAAFCSKAYSLVLVNETRSYCGF